jgi:hypothetical protein
MTLHNLHLKDIKELGSNSLLNILLMMHRLWAVYRVLHMTESRTTLASMPPSAERRYLFSNYLLHTSQWNLLERLCVPGRFIKHNMATLTVGYRRYFTFVPSRLMRIGSMSFDGVFRGGLINKPAFTITMQGGFLTSRWTEVTFFAGINICGSGRRV